MASGRRGSRTAILEIGWAEVDAPRGCVCLVFSTRSCSRACQLPAQRRLRVKLPFRFTQRISISRGVVGQAEEIYITSRALPVHFLIQMFPIFSPNQHVSVEI